MAINKAVLISIVILALTGVVLAVLSSGLLVAQQSVSTSGNVGGSILSSVNIGVFSDVAATSNCSSIDWGSLSAGSTVTQTVYVKNTGSTPETLSMATSDWNPSSANSSLTLTWNMEGASLPAGSVVAATLTLTVAANTGSLTSFSFNIVISGSAQ